MTDQAAFEACASLVRRGDPDRYFSALFAPAEARPFLFALYAFNLEVARVAETVREPMLGLIRLEWWRETLVSAREGKPRAHDVARALAALFAAHALPQELFDGLLDARSFDISAEEFTDLAALERYTDATSGNLMRLAACLLGAGEGAEVVARSAGLAYGLTGIVRAVPFHAQRRKLYLPRDLVEANGLDRDEVFKGKGGDALARVVWQIVLRARGHLAEARQARFPKGVLAAFLPAALVPLYLKRLARTGFDPFRATEVPIHRRQMRLLSASLRGRV